MLAEDAENQAYRDMLAVAKSGQPRLHQFTLSAFAIEDELSILYLPGEMFAEYQLFFNQISPFKHTLGFCLYQRNLGYVATMKAYDLGSAGGYEASSTRCLSLDP